MVINFSGISRSRPAGRALRWPLRLIPKGAVVRILQGPLRGKRWIVGSSNHGCWLGSYEAAKQRKIMAVARPGMVCWDVGAHVGFYTLLFAELIGRRGKVYAFEPASGNVELLRRHVEMNGYGNVSIFSVALGDRDGEAAFDPGPNSSMGHLSEAGAVRVQCRRADTLLGAGEVEAPDLIKLDVEDAVAAVLREAERVLKGRPLVFVATRGEKAHRECTELLAGFGYVVRSLDGGPAEASDELVAVPSPGAGG